MKPRLQHRRAGFATLMALLMLAIVAVAILSITSLVALEAKRTRHLKADAQLDQLLLAGTTAARQRLATPAPGGDGAVKLPPEAGEATLSVSIKPENGGQMAATISAEAEGWKASQQVVFEKQGTAWQLVSVRRDER